MLSLITNILMRMCAGVNVCMCAGAVCVKWTISRHYDMN
jgi:hypothetical protein